MCFCHLGRNKFALKEEIIPVLLVPIELVKLIILPTPKPLMNQDNKNVPVLQCHTVRASVACLPLSQ